MAGSGDGGAQQGLNCDYDRLGGGGGGTNGIRLVDFTIRLRIRSWALVIR